MVKKIFKTVVVWILILYFVSALTSGLTFKNGLLSIVITAIALAVASRFVKPIVNLFLLPLNLITFGFFQFLNNVIALFLVNIILPDFKVGAFFLKGYQSSLIVIPSISFPEGLISYIAFSFLISLAGTIIYWLIE